MTIRIRFDITWVMDRPVVPGTHYAPADHEAFLRQHLEQAFAAQDSRLRIRQGDLDDNRIEIRALFDVNLAETPGHWYMPEDHKQHIETLIGVIFQAQTPSVEVQIWRQADFREALDHGEILRHYGAEAARDDYPVFRPEPHADWEEADEAFLQDGFWWWCVSDEMQGDDPFAEHGPAAGPVPEAIYTPWDAGARTRDFAPSALALRAAA